MTIEMGERTETAHGEAVVTAYISDGHVVAQLTRFIHRRHHSQHLGHFGLQFGYLSLA